jgi:hypothetical protein
LPDQVDAESQIKNVQATGRYVARTVVPAADRAKRHAY